MTLSIDDAKALVIDFCATYPVASSLGYKLRETQEELYGPHATREAAGTILGSFHPGGGRVLFATSNFGSDEEFKRSLRHEVLGHFGINTFNPAEKRAVLDGIIEARNEPSTAGIWAKVDQLYPGISDSRKAEEVFAFACEDIESLAYRNAIGGAQSFRETCIERSRPMQIRDLINVTTMVAEGLHDRSRSQQIFPASDDAQFKLETTPNTSEYPVWLAVPHDAREAARVAAGKLENGQSAIGWDKESSLWFARPGADLDRVAQWLPDTSIRSGGGDPEAEFLDALTREGLVIQGMPVMDGQRHRVATVEDKKGNKSGVYRGFLDRRPGGWFINYHRAETEKSVTNWSAKGGESDPMARLHIRAAARQSQEDAVRVREQLYAQQTLAAKRLYDRLPGADPAHPYLVRKGIPPTPDLRQTRNGALVVPFFNASGTFKTLQYIPPDGEKYLFKDAPKQGHFLVVGGSLTPGQPVLYAEGYATARSVNLATGLPVVMTIDAGNMVAVAKVLHEQLPDNRHVFLADLDHAKEQNKGLLMATAAAEQVGGQVLYPAFTDEEKALGLTDFNDLHQSRGLDALRSQIGPVLAHENEVPTMQEEKAALEPAATSALVDSVLPPAAPQPLTFTHNGEPATIDLERFQPQPQVEPPAAQVELELPVVPAPLTFTHMGQPASLGVSQSVSEFSPEVAAELLEDQVKSGGGNSVPSVKTAQHLQLENQAGQSLSLEVATLLAEDIAKSGGGHSIIDSWVALKAEAERHGYVPHLDLPYDVSNLEIDYTDPQGGSTPIYTTLYPGGEVQTIYDGAQMHREISIDMEDQKAAVRGSIEMDAEKKGVPTLLSFTHNGEPATIDLERFQPQPQAEQPTAPVEPESPVIAAPAPLAFTHNGEPAAVEVKPEPVPVADETTRSQRRAEEQLSMVLEPAPSAQTLEQADPAASDDPVPAFRPSSETGNETSPAAGSEVDAILVGALRPSGTEVEPQASHIDKDALLTRIAWEKQSDSQTLYTLDGEPAFVDRGNRLEMATGAGQHDEKIIAALLMAAQFYRGSIELTGSDEFKAKAIGLIAQHQINVEMKNPVQRALLNDARKALTAEPVVPDAIAGEAPPAFGPAPTQHSEPVPEPVPAQPQTAPVLEVEKMAIASQPAAPNRVAEPGPENVVAQPQGLSAEIHQPAEKAKDRVVGKVMECGTAPYHFDKNNDPSTYIKLRTKTGMQTFWGKELAGLMRETRVQPGKLVTLQWLGKEAVVVKVPVKNEQGATMRYEDKSAHRNQWALTVKGAATVRTGQDEGVKLAPYDAARFAVVQQTVINRLGLDVPVPTPPVQGLYWMTPNGQGSAKAGDELSAQRPAIDPKRSAGQPVISSWSQDGHLDMLLVRGDGPYLQGVVRQGNEFQHVLVSLPGTQDAPAMVFNAITPEGLVPIGTGNAINRSGGVPVSRENIAFKLEGDNVTRIAKLDAPAEIPPALHARLGFDERWKEDNTLPKSAPTAAPAAQPSDPRPA
ncbi:LPD7 domain-containing protein [Pseudomonas fluorescens]|uniref:LPD7 domain-containing protein n=1 Tax=Pseudomonas fluorescens TaxID=294 RepID=UPI001BE71935|nr:LPD7 domain-containing protein [Pseudomonas fluorescens]MBT2375560.1 DNA primase [Pseudomonas fluorescens]